MATKDFERIYLGGKNGPLAAGKFKLSEVGVGWKNSMTGQIITVSVSDIQRMNWLKVARDYEIRILKKGGSVLKFDGFPKDAFDGISSLVHQFYGKNLTPVDISSRGYNWGLAEFQGSQLSFSVHGKQAFEIPLTDVANTAVSAKSEVSIEFALPRHEKGEKVLEDSLVEVRLYIPGGVTEGMIRVGQNEGKVLRDRVDQNPDAMDLDPDEDDNDNMDEDGNDKDGKDDKVSKKIALDKNGDALTAAALFCETIKQKSDANVSLSELIVGFAELLCVTPRGRYQVDMHQDHLRLRGKTHDYKIMYSSINRLIVVPRPDDLYFNFVVGIHPPLRQGQTRYPYLVFQFDREQELELSLNLEEAELAEKYNGKLEKNYDGPAYQVVSEIFSGLSGRKVLEAAGAYRSAQAQQGVKCFHKATEAFLYPLDKAFLAVSKPPIYFSFSEIANVTFSRVSNATASTKTFEIKFNLVSGTEYIFSSLPREEHPPLEKFCSDKKLSIYSEIDEMAPTEGRRGATAGTYEGDIMQESESEDEDFIAKEMSDVDEEFDSEFSSEEEDGEGEGERKKKRKGSDAGSGSEEEEEEEATNVSASSGTKKAKKPSKVADKPSKGEPKKKRAKKEGPKRALTSYIYFSNEMRGSIREKHPEMGLGDIAKELGVMWKSVTSEEKEKFEAMAARDKERYNRELKEFQRTGVLPAGAAASSKTKASTAAVAKIAKKDSPLAKSSSNSKVKSEEYIRDSDDEDDF